MSDFEELIIKTAAVLERLNIPYVITGGAGVVVWGRPRFTADIDIAVELKAADIGPLAHALRAVLGETAMVDEAMMRSEQDKGGEFNVLHPESGLKIDFFMLGATHFDREKIARRVYRNVGEQRVAFISPEDLILTKLLWYKESDSSRHREDAESIFRIQGKKLDLGYLKRMAERLGIRDLSQF